MTPLIHTLTLTSPDDTCDLATGIGALLSPGHTLLLSGGIGAGKTHFARCLIQSLQSTAEDVPSPSFTLVQTYETARGEIWHSDLYRLNGPDDVIELGLEQAFETAICLVEWPDRLGDLAPPHPLLLDFAVVDDTTRRVTLSGDAEIWRPVLEPVLKRPARD